jgi:CDP-2,3-bis-(O-geranylgeranyl)-sn-glycerol synthase
MRDSAFHVLQLLYFMLPAYVANMAPPFVRFRTGWNRPIHARLLGEHKTVQGFALGVVAGVLATAAQASIATPLAMVDYRNWPLLGLAFGFGAMAGDSIKSLFKRKAGIVAGGRWVPFDQLDFVLGALLLVGYWAGLTWQDVAVILLFSLVAGLLVKRLAFRLHIKQTPW